MTACLEGVTPMDPIEELRAEIVARIAELSEEEAASSPLTAGIFRLMAAELEAILSRLDAIREKGQDDDN
jgi:hypothetical protein